MKKLFSFILALALLMSCLPLQRISFAETVADAQQESFNLFNANSYYWKKESWSSSNSLGNGQLNLVNGIYLYTGYELGTETVSYVVNHNSITSGYYDIYLRSDVDFSSAAASGSSIQSGNPILIRYSMKDKEFLLFEGTFGSSDADAKIWVDLTDGEDHTVEIITTEDVSANTTTIQLCVDGKIRSTYEGLDYWSFEGIKGMGNIGFVRYSDTAVTLKNFGIESVEFDPYYTDGFIADFENCTDLAISNSTGATVALSAEAAYSGSSSVYLDDTASGTVAFALSSAANTKALRENVTYRVTAWVKAVDGVGKSINFSPKTVVERNSVSGQKGSAMKSFSWWGLDNYWATMMDRNEADDWRKVLITSDFRIESGYEFPIVSIWATGGGSGWYIDDIAFEAVFDTPVAVSENTEYGTVSYTNYLKLNTAATVLDTVAVCAGDSVTATATANAGYRFEGWYKGDECVSQAIKYTYIADGETLTAHFVRSDSSAIYQGWEQQGIDGFAYKVADNSAAAIITDTVSHTGEYSVKVATNGTQSNYLFSCSDNTTPALDVGKKYQAFIWVKPGATGRMNIQLCGVADLNSNKNTTSYAAFNTANQSKIINAATDSTADGWYRVCIGQFTAVDDRPYASIYCWVDTSVAADFEWYYDDLELIAVEDNISVQDFENTPANFSISAGNATVEVTDAEAISGNNSLMIKTGESSSNVFTALFDSSTAPLEVDSSYRVTMWMKIKQASSNFNVKLTSVDEVNNYNAAAIGSSFADEQITKGRLSTYYVNKSGTKSYGVDSNTVTDWYNACIVDNYVAAGKYVKFYVWMPANCEVYIDKVVFTKVNTVTASVESGGQVSASNGLTYKQLNSSTVTLSSSVADNETVHLTALPDSGYNFTGWQLNGETVSTSTDFDVVPTENAVYTAVFTGETPVYDEITADDITSTLTTGDVNTVTNKQFIDESLSSMGNSDRIASAMKKAMNGENITIGFIGGSITEGAGASDKTKSWAYTVYNWFAETFPNCNVEYVNAAIAGSYSRLGVTYTDTQLMSAEPDIVFLDYSVNDGNGLYKDSYETIIRKILVAENKPGLAVVDFTRESVDAWSYYNEQAIYDALAVYYGLPIINIHKAITPFFESGLLSWDDYSDDSIHPNDTGHAMVAAAVINYLAKAEAYAAENDSFVPYELKEEWYFGESELDGAFMSYADEIAAEANGFTADGRVSRFSWNAFTSSVSGSTLTFNLKNCTEAVIVYGQSGSVVPSDMEIYVNGVLYTTVSPVQDSTPWCVANITSIAPMDMEIVIVTLEDSICNIAGVYANVGEELATEVETLRNSLALLDEMDIDTASQEIATVEEVINSASENAADYVTGAKAKLADAQTAVDELEQLVSVRAVEIISATAENDILTINSGIDVKQWNAISSAGFTADTYAVAVLPTAKLNGELKKDTALAQVVEYTAPIKRAVYKTYVKGINTDARKTAELTARSFVTYTRDGFAINVYSDVFTAVYSSLVQ